MHSTNKWNLLIAGLLTIGSHLSTAQSNSNCEAQSLFSPMPNHEIQRCETKEFDQHDFLQSTANGSYETLTKEGETFEVWYNWTGEWASRPSKTQIYKNYQTAIEKQGGELLYSASSAYFRFKKSGDTYYLEVNTDGSGMYSVITLKESGMRQDVVFAAQEIGKAIDQDGQITFYGIYFDLNKASLKPESASTLKEIAAYLKANTAKQVYMVGHTDNTGAHDYNLKLSKERAQAAVDELIKNYGVSATQLSPDGVGALCPVSNNFTEADRAKNRRVVMVLKK
jgi:outer membrane protein OmpA-like peptidoglycan-associated protein